MSQTHDFTMAYWGHNVNVMTIRENGQRISVAGWTSPHPHADDFLILPNGSSSTRYRLLSVRPAGQPGDMWFGEAVFAARQEQPA